MIGPKAIVLAALVGGLLSSDAAAGFMSDDNFPKAPSADGLGAYTGGGPLTNADMAAAAFAIRGFSCTSWDPAYGMTCRGKLAASVYPEEIAIIIPVRYRVRAKADVLLHLHGFTDRSFTAILNDYKFEQLLADSGRDVIMVIPYSTGQCTTYINNFKSQDSFRKFLDAVGDLLNFAGLSSSSDIASLIGSGHSGAFEPIDYILKHTDMSEVYLFDSMYGFQDDFADYASGLLHRFISAFMPGGKTETANFLAWKKLHPEVPQGAAAWKAFRSSLLPVSPSTSEVKTVQTGFLQSDQDHSLTVTKYFALFLKR